MSKLPNRFVRIYTVTDEFYTTNVRETFIYFKNGFASVVDNLDNDEKFDIYISNFSSLLVGAVGLKTLLHVGLAHIANHKYVKLRLNYFIISILQITKNSIMNIITFLKEDIPLKKIHVIHENTEWTRHLTKRLEELDLPYEE